MAEAVVVNHLFWFLIGGEECTVGTPCGGEAITRNSLCHTERDETVFQHSPILTWLPL